MERSTKERWIFGVCGGIANSFGVSPNLVRLLTVIVAVIIPGFSVIPAVAIYLVLGLVLPKNEYA